MGVKVSCEERKGKGRNKRREEEIRICEREFHEREKGKE